MRAWSASSLALVLVAGATCTSLNGAPVGGGGGSSGNAQSGGAQATGSVIGSGGLSAPGGVSGGNGLIGSGGAASAGGGGAMALGGGAKATGGSTDSGTAGAATGIADRANAGGIGGGGMSGGAGGATAKPGSGGAGGMVPVGGGPMNPGGMGGAGTGGAIGRSNCANGTRDGDETDIDCGGGDCTDCGPGKGCLLPSDCTTGACDAGRCALYPLAWTPMDSMSCTRDSLIAARMGETIVAIGGGHDCVPPDPDFAFRSMEEFRSGTWTRPAVPKALSYGFGMVGTIGSDGRVYMAGGESDSGSSARASTLGWSGIGSEAVSLARMSIGREFAAMTAGTPDGVVISGGATMVGGTSIANCLPSVELFKPGPDLSTQGTWSFLPPLDIYRCGHAAATVADGRILAIGGQYALTDAATALASVESLSPGASNWVNLAPLPTARSFLAAVTGPDGRVYAIGGEVSGLATGRVDAYDPKSDRWYMVPALGQPRAKHAVVVGPDNRIFAIGGLVNVGADRASTAGVEAYGPTFTLLPSQGPPGTQVTVVGERRSPFAPSASVQVSWEGSAKIVGTASTDLLGNLPSGGTGDALKFTVPSGSSPGFHDVSVVDSKSQFPVRSRFEVK